MFTALGTFRKSKMKGLIMIMAMCILIVGCKEVKRCETNLDCNESELCYDDGSYLHLKYCRETPNYYNTTNQTTPLIGGMATIPIVVYPDGNNETKARVEKMK